MITSKSNFKKTSKRIEIKEVFKTKDLNILDRAIKLSGFSFRKTFPTRRVNSVYFDTIKMDLLTQSLEGNRDRKKIRVRWYGDAEKECDATLEIKNKEGVVSWKNLYEKQIIVTPNAERWDNFLKYDSNKLYLKNTFKTFLPASIVSYKRDYYESKNKKIRITIDQDLRSYQQMSRLRVNFSYYKDHSSLVIMEIKTSYEEDKLLKRVLQDFPFSAKRFSKYCESLLPQTYYQ
jgi:hypothetical protein